MMVAVAVASSGASKMTPHRTRQSSSRKRSADRPASRPIRGKRCCDPQGSWQTPSRPQGCRQTASCTGTSLPDLLLRFSARRAETGFVPRAKLPRDPSTLLETLARYTPPPPPKSPAALICMRIKLLESNISKTTPKRAVKIHLRHEAHDSLVMFTPEPGSASPPDPRPIEFLQRSERHPSLPLPPLGLREPPAALLFRDGRHEAPVGVDGLQSALLGGDVMG